MDARERTEKIAKAAYDIGVEELSLEWDQVLDARLKKDWVVATQAAVRAAYEIDGVRELVGAADDVERIADLAMRQANNDGAEYDIDAELSSIRAAAARVRDAMGGGE